jgi:hypothetical protein
MVLFVTLFGSEKADSKFDQARGKKKIIKFSGPVWHLSTTPPPDALYVHQETCVVDQAASTKPAIETSPINHEAQLGSDYVWQLDDGSVWVGSPGKRKLLPSESVEALKMMPLMKHYPARAAIQKIVNLKCDDEKLFKGLIDSGIITCHGTRDYTGDMQGMKNWLEEEASNADRAEEEAPSQRQAVPSEKSPIEQEAEKLKDLPPNTGMVELVDFIGSHCDTPELGWADVFHYARENGFIIFNEGVSCGANHQPVIEPG